MLNHLKNQRAGRIDCYLALDILLGLFFNIYGLRNIDWAITYEKYHVFCAESCSFLFVNLAVVILITVFRKNDTIHTVYNISVKLIIYFIFLLNAIGMILIFFTLIHLLSDLSSPVGNVVNKRRFQTFVRRQWNVIFYSMSLVLIFNGLQFPLWYNAVKRVEMKTDGNIERDGVVDIV